MAERPWSGKSGRGEVRTARQHEPRWGLGASAADRSPNSHFPTVAAGQVAVAVRAAAVMTTGQAAAAR